MSANRDRRPRNLEDQEMAGKRKEQELIVAKLRQVEALQGPGVSIADAASQRLCIVGVSNMAG